jgi:hypothetical protein
MSDPVDPWQEYRKRRKLVLLAAFGYLPIVFGTAVATEYLFHTSGPVIPVMFGWLIFLGVANARCQRFTCPRCRKLFFVKYGSFERRDQPQCVHCGLLKYAPPESSP